LTCSSEKVGPGTKIATTNQAAKTAVENFI
jgi:hypothetical protein